ncbi:MAG: FliA/WhiG family RNA polymerase sigma factor [Thermodesulfobacteriota bacterium]
MVFQYEQAGETGNGVFDSRTREAMIVKYAYLVKRIAGRMASRLPSSVMMDELVSAGCIGLIDAIDKYDPQKEVNLQTYAEYRIKGAILDELRNMDWYSRSMRKKIRDIEKAIATVESRAGRGADDQEIADELGIELEQYYKYLTDIHGTAMLSLDEFIRNQDNETLSQKRFQDKIRSQDDPSGNFAREEMKQVVAKAITNLSEKEQLVISLYYHDELTLNEIGKVLKLTESRICQIHTTALIKLRNKLKAFYE